MMEAIRREPAYVASLGDLEQDRESVLEVWRGNIGKATHLAAKFDWFYRQNPGGPPLFMLLHHSASGEAIGVGAAGPRRLVLGDQTITAGVLSDLAVSAHHRSLGPALSLQKALTKSAIRRFDFVYGFPNPKALPVFRRAGFEIVGSLERYVCLLRHEDYLARHMPASLATALSVPLDMAGASRLALRGLGAVGLRAYWAECADRRIDRLWATSKKSSSLATVRNAEFLHWRFERLPFALIRYLLVEDAKSGELVAFFACEREGGHLHVMDAWSRRGTAGMARSPIVALLRAARREGCISVSAELSGSSLQLSGWREAGFVLRQRRPIVGLWTRQAPTPAPIFLGTAADEDE